MKKLTLSALSLALLAGSAQAYTVFHDETSGTKLDIDGSLRLAWRSDSSKDRDGDGNITAKSHVNRAVYNNGSRLGFKLTQQLGNDFYAVGRMQFRLKGDASSQHNFDHAYTHIAYAAIGHKRYGELQYGNLVPQHDNIRQTDLANTLSFSDGLFSSLQRNTLQYVVKATPELELGAFYSFHARRNASATRLTNDKENAYGVSAIYKKKIDDVQKFTLAGGFERQNYANNDGNEYGVRNYAFGSAYTYAATTFALDFDHRETSNLRSISYGKRYERDIRGVIYQKITDDWRVYTQAGYVTTKTEQGDAVSRVKSNKYMLGTEYFFLQEPVKVKGFVEGQYVRTVRYNSSGTLTAKEKDKAAVIGLRVYW